MDNSKVNVTVGFFGVGWWAAAGAAYAIHGSLWAAFWRGFLVWAYLGYLWAKATF